MGRRVVTVSLGDGVSGRVTPKGRVLLTFPERQKDGSLSLDKGDLARLLGFNYFEVKPP